MAIILEGFDNSGKSTLAKAFGLEVLHPGPRPKTAREELACLEDQQRQARCPVVMDRVTCISTPCYKGNLGDPAFQLAQAQLLKTHHCVLIYCRPHINVIKDFSKHETKSYDDVKQVDWLIRNADRIVKSYDTLMRRLPHMIYDYTNPDPNVIQVALDSQFTIGAWRQCHELMNRRN